jgi:hypothetical protein
MLADTTYSYAFVVRGVAHNWAGAEDLKGVIEEIEAHSASQLASRNA